MSFVSLVKIPEQCLFCIYEISAVGHISLLLNSADFSAVLFCSLIVKGIHN